MNHFRILTEAGGRLLTETGNYLVYENAGSSVATAAARIDVIDSLAREDGPHTATWVPGSVGVSINRLNNPGFEGWALGPGPFTSSASPNVVTADYWEMYDIAGGRLRTTREGGIVDGGQYSAKIDYLVAFANVQLQQRLDYITPDIAVQWRGKTLTFTCRVNTNVASTCGLLFFDSIALDLSPLHSGSGLWETLSVTHTVNVNASIIELAIVFSGPTCTAYVDNAKLNLSTDVEYPSSPSLASNRVTVVPQDNRET